MSRAEDRESEIFRLIEKHTSGVEIEKIMKRSEQEYLLNIGFQIEENVERALSDMPIIASIKHADEEDDRRGNDFFIKFKGDCHQPLALQVKRSLSSAREFKRQKNNYSGDDRLIVIAVNETLADSHIRHIFQKELVLLDGFI